MPLISNDDWRRLLPTEQHRRELEKRRLAHIAELLALAAVTDDPKIRTLSGRILALDDVIGRLSIRHTDDLEIGKND
jgi:hypothetical protein